MTYADWVAIANAVSAALSIAALVVVVSRR